MSGWWIVGIVAAVTCVAAASRLVIYSLRQDRERREWDEAVR